MEYTNISWKIRSPIYLYVRTHICPDCGAKLSVVKKSKILRAESEEAREHRMRGHSGNVKLVWWEFECPDCGRSVSVAEMKRLEGYPD